jgi:hypothetical protein
MRFLPSLLLVLTATLALAGPAGAQSSSSHHSHQGSGSSSHSHKSSGHGVPCGNSYISPDKTCHISGGSNDGDAPKASVPQERSGGRDEHGRIKRSESAKRKFEQETGHPHGWKGHIVDHIVPLACGGADDPSNMQWQTTAEGKAKDKTERQGCKVRH